MRDIQKEIQDNLDTVEREHQVKILLAVESGSRAWGFASTDSDYDVRFIYVRRPEEYLRIDSIKEVIEWQLDEVLDMNGWDLKKALLAFGKGNPNIMEWANSPIVYRKAPAWDQISKAALSYFSEKAALCHYYGTARSTLQGYLTGEQIRYKKYFYDPQMPVIRDFIVSECERQKLISEAAKDDHHYEYGLLNEAFRKTLGYPAGQEI